PIVAQIYGHTTEMFYKVAHIVCELGFDGSDINMGCPAKKVAAKGSGAALILNPSLARSIIQRVYQGVKDWCEGQSLSDLNIDPDFIQKTRIANRLRTGVERPLRRRLIPVSVKTRIGYDQVVVEEWMQTLLEESSHFEKHWGLQCFVGMRKHLAWYCRGSPRAAELRSQMVQVSNVGEVMDCLRNYTASIASEFQPKERAPSARPMRSSMASERLIS